MQDRVGEMKRGPGEMRWLRGSRTSTAASPLAGPEFGGEACTALRFPPWQNET